MTEESNIRSVFVHLHPRGEEPERPPRPRVPSLAVFVLFAGKAEIIKWFGDDLAYWIETMGMDETAKDLAQTWADGIGAAAAPLVCVWKGKIRTSRDYYGEYDAWLEEDEVRRVTEEEWAILTAQEEPWYLDELRARDEWEEQEREQTHVPPEESPPHAVGHHVLDEHGNVLVIDSVLWDRCKPGWRVLGHVHTPKPGGPKFGFETYHSSRWKRV